MKTVQISQIKDEDFSSVDLIDKCIFINKKNLNKTHTEIKEVHADVEGLREALFFKQEKLKLQLRSIKDKINDEEINDLHKKVNSLKINPLGESKEVLQRNKEIFELKLLNKVLRYAIEIENGNINVLKSLLRSEDKDDWRFLCFFIRNTLDVYDGDNKNSILEVSKEIQEKLINVFGEGKKISNKTIMKSAYTALEELDTNHTLLQTYIYDMEIFQNTYEMSHPEVEEIDIELYEEENNTFLHFINELKSSYQDNLVDISEIFTNYEEAYKIVDTKIFSDLIYPTLENFLKGVVPFVFLYSIESAYKNIHNLGIYIESISINFDCKTVLDEITQRYSAICIDKERSFFKEIFDKLVYGTKTSKKYIFKNENISLSKDYDNIIDTLIAVVDLFNIRSKFLYDEDDISDMHAFYGEHFGKLLEVVQEDINNKIDAISQIQKIVSRLKRYFKDNFYKLDTLTEKQNNIIKEALSWKIEQCEGRIKQIIASILFYRPESDIYILEYLKEQIYESKKIRGETQLNFVEEVLSISYENLKSRIFNLRFSISQKKNLKDFIGKFLQYVILTGNYKLISKYKYLENIMLIITVDKSNIQDVYETLKYKLKKEDMKSSIKCRNDKDAVILK